MKRSDIKIGETYALVRSSSDNGYKPVEITVIDTGYVRGSSWRRDFQSTSAATFPGAHATHVLYRTKDGTSTRTAPFAHIKPLAEQQRRYEDACELRRVREAARDAALTANAALKGRVTAITGREYDCYYTSTGSFTITAVALRKLVEAAEAAR